jgi:predicted nucleic acid-binding protein
VICFDTMVLIWGLQKQARPGQENMIELASRYIESLDPKETVMIPSVVLSEYLTGFRDAAVRKEQAATIARRFFVPAFDAPAAALAAELMLSPAALHLREGVSRKQIKADAQIIGTAIQHGAEKIVTGNLFEYTTLAAGKINVIDIPIIHVQRPLDLHPLLGPH